MSSWVKSQEGKHVGSDATDHKQTECWDLAMAAIEHARAKGFSVPRGPSTYEWSSQTVSYKDAQPGDIVQFVSWKEKTGHSSRSTGSHHTAVVTLAWNSQTCGLQTEGQNPSPVHQAVYHPCSPYHISGSMVVYRLGGSTPSPSPSPPPSPSPFTGKYQVGDHVEGLYKDGIWYAATIVKINSDGTYTLEWADGGTRDTVKPESKIRPPTSPSPSPASKYQVGELVEGLFKDGYWYKATIVKINSDGTYTLKWADGGTQDTVKPESKIRISSGDGALAST